MSFRDQQLVELREDLIDAKVVAGWHNGISGSSAMVHMLECNGQEECTYFRVVTYPVMIEGTSTPICWVSWTYDIKDGPEGKERALEVCKEQATWIVSKINR